MPPFVDERSFPRGSEWREWDLHIHSPASFHWAGDKFGQDAAKNAALVDTMIEGLNMASPAAFAIMDYWTFDGWLALQKRLSEAGASKLMKTVFPGIELRLMAPMDGRLNAHVIFSNSINKQQLVDFKSKLKLEIVDRPLSNDGLIEYARAVGADKLKVHGYKKEDVLGNDAIALAAGNEIAEINCDSYKDAIESVPEGLAVGFMPFSTNDGLQNVKWAEHYAYVLKLFRASPIFETRDPTLWAAFAGIKTEKNKNWIANFQEALGGLPRLAVSGSDAHRITGIPGNNDARGYGNFPTGKATWIKADPTWRGLLQAIHEPAKRSYLGDVPDKVALVRQNKTFFIDTVGVSKVPNSSLQDTWLADCDVPLNCDLVAIIGNKGSGKSALADVVALLGNSQQKNYFSFLKKDRFRGKAGEPARQFQGIMNWLAGQPNSLLLSDDPQPERVEMVRYIPQGRFEALCNDHVSGRSDAFERELRDVIFSHVPQNVRQGALNFDQLIEQQEARFRASLGELRKALRATNAEIVSLEDQLHPNAKRNVQELLSLKLKQLEEHRAAEPKEVPEPTGELSPEQQRANARLQEIAQTILGMDQADKATEKARELVSRKQLAIRNIRDRLAILKAQVGQFSEAVSADLELIELPIASVASIKLDSTALDKMATALLDEGATLNVASQEQGKLRAELEAERAKLDTTLDEPQQHYQKYLATKREWERIASGIEGDANEPESKKGLERRLEQITSLPAALENLQKKRLGITRDIFDILSSQRQARAELFSPVQELIERNSLIREGYKLQFRANLQGSPAVIGENLFGIIKQNVGELRGEDESLAAIRSRFEKYPPKDAESVISFVSNVYALLSTTAKDVQGNIPGIRGILRKSKEPENVYDFLFGLEYIQPKYTLLFQDAEIEQLSPGQRGALLLIFYLLVDKGRNPIVLDQPEENLDNETVVSLLAPVLNEAKKSRQIIMVTHNPNLAVYCDAEQIIHATFDRKNGSKISYHSGSIEDGVINRAAVDVLEGTKVAFNNRGRKYHE